MENPTQKTNIISPFCPQNKNNYRIDIQLINNTGTKRTNFNIFNV